MADIQVQEQADELAVALVQALARQDGGQALSIGTALGAIIGDRPALRARHAAWMGQAHQLQGNLEEALCSVREAITLAQTAEEIDALPALKALKVELVTGRAAVQAAAIAPLPDTLLGRALKAMDEGDTDDGARLARRARLQAQSEGDFRGEVFSLLALARVPGQEDSAIRAAYTVADSSDDKNLVTAVARAARAAAVPLPKSTF
jgi:hypothetical protein